MIINIHDKLTTMPHTPETTRITKLVHSEELPQSNTSSPERSFCEVKYKDYESALAAIQQLESELNEFQTSSYELEKELEKELSALELDNEELKLKNVELCEDLKELQNKKFAMEKELEKVCAGLESKLERLEKELEVKNSKIVDIEILNDNIEQNERNLNVSYKELEENYHSAMEKIILLEQELSDARDLTMKEQLNHQNTKNEMAEWRSKYEAALKPKKTSTNPRPLSQTKMSKSNSMRQLHTMIEQSKGMESRIGNIKTSLNSRNFRLHGKSKSSTTTKLTNTTITTSTPLASHSKVKRKIPLSPSSFKLSSLTNGGFAKMEKIEGSPAKPATDFNKIFGGEFEEKK